MRFQTRFTILASSVPLIVIAVMARHQFTPAVRPCIAVGDLSMQVAIEPFFSKSGQAQISVAFTDDPTHATVRVQIVDTPESADFSVVDDIDSTEADACPVNLNTRYVGIAAMSTAGDPVILLTEQGDADYRIFVRSRSFTTREAAALIVGARGTRPNVATAAL